MLPQIGRSLHVSSSAAATSVTVYFIPFALFQLFSGTLGERWGRRRTVQIAYLSYAVASLACALAPTLWLFLAGRAALGAANAFTSPLLLAGLGDAVPPDRRSRAVGIFSSFQAAGQSFAPLVGGATAAYSWRLGFVVVAVAGLLLLLAPPPGAPRPGASAPSWRPLISVPMGFLSVAALLSFMSASGLPFLVALYADGALGLRPDLTGLALAGYGLAGLLLGSVWGGLTGRLGARVCGAAGAVATALFVALAGTTGSVYALVACWTAAGAAASLLTVALQNLAMNVLPSNRGGALSAVSAFRFAGSALAPLAWLPVYHASPALAFAAAGASLLLIVPALRLVGENKAVTAGRAPGPR